MFTEFRRKTELTIISLIVLFGTINSCSLEDRAIELNARVSDIEESTFYDFSLLKRSDYFLLRAWDYGVGTVLLNDQDSVELLSGSPKLTRAFDTDTTFQRKLHDALSYCERTRTYSIHGGSYADSTHSVRVCFGLRESILIYDSVPSNELLKNGLGKKYYVFEDSLRYYIKTKKRHY